MAQSEFAEQDYRNKAAAFQAAVDKARQEERERGSAPMTLFVVLLAWGIVVATVPLLIALGDYLGQEPWPHGYINQVGIIAMSALGVAWILLDALLVLVGVLAITDGTD